MALSNNKLDKLLHLVSTTQNDGIDCDKCLEHIAQYAEENLQGLTPCEQLIAIKVHLESCPCCQDEYSVFMEAFATLQEEEGCS